MNICYLGYFDSGLGLINSYQQFGSRAWGESTFGANPGYGTSGIGAGGRIGGDYGVIGQQSTYYGQQSQ